MMDGAERLRLCFYVPPLVSSSTQELEAAKEGREATWTGWKAPLCTFYISCQEREGSAAARLLLAAMAG